MINNMKTNHFLTLATLFSALTAVPAFGAVVSFHDLGGAYTSQVPPTATTGPTDDTQTGPNGSYILLDYDTGDATGVTLTVDGVGNHSAGAYVTEGDVAALFPDSSVINYGNALYLSSTHTYTFTGLVAGYSYDVAIYANRAYAPDNGNATRSATYALSGATSFTNTSSTGTPETGVIANDGGASVTLQNGSNHWGNLARWSDIVPEGDSITITITGNGYSGNALRFESTVIPEPATAALAGLGAFGLLLRRRSRLA